MKKFIIGILAIIILIPVERAIAQALTPQQIQQAQQAISAFNAEYSNDENQIQNLQTRLSSHFGTKVNIKADKNNKGEIKIPFISAEDLNRILEVLNF